MTGLLAWAADVVGRGGESNGEDYYDAIPVVFTPEQQQYVRELGQKAASLSRYIQDLRPGLPPPDIFQRLRHLHVHSLASNAALAPPTECSLRHQGTDANNVQIHAICSDNE